MANISPYTQAIRSARYGEEVRSAIASALEVINEEAERAFGTKILPPVVPADEGKALIVDSTGSWSPGYIPWANGENF